MRPEVDSGPRLIRVVKRFLNRSWATHPNLSPADLHGEVSLNNPNDQHGVARHSYSSGLNEGRKLFLV